MQKVPETPITSEVRAALEEYTQRLMKLYPERFTESDPKAWREDCLAKQAAGVRFEKLHYPSGKWFSSSSGGFIFTGNKEDYREVPKKVQKNNGIKIPKTTRKILKEWHKQGLKFNCGEIFLCLGNPQFSDRREYYTIPKQPIPECMSVKMVEAMWRHGLMLEFNYNEDKWTEVKENFGWNVGHTSSSYSLARLRIPAQPIPEKLLEVPQEVFASECQKAALEHLAKTYSADKGTAQLNPPTPHAAERALWKAQREAGTNEVWQWAYVDDPKKIWTDIRVDHTPTWQRIFIYRVKPMKLTASIVRRKELPFDPFKLQVQDWEFFGTREEYRAECEKYGYVVVSEIKEVVEKPKTVKYYFALVRGPLGGINSLAASSMESFNRLAENLVIIGDIEERDVEV